MTTFLWRAVKFSLAGSEQREAQSPAVARSGFREDARSGLLLTAAVGPLRAVLSVSQRLFINRKNGNMAHRLNGIGAATGTTIVWATRNGSTASRTYTP